MNFCDCWGGDWLLNYYIYALHVSALRTMQRATPESNRDHWVSASCTPIHNMDTSPNCSRWGAVQSTSLAERKLVMEMCALIYSLHKLWPANTHSSPCTEVCIHNIKTMFLLETVGHIRCLHLRNTLKIDLSWKCEVEPHYLQFHQSHMQPGPHEPVFVLPIAGQALFHLKEHPVSDSTFPASFLSHTTRRSGHGRKSFLHYRLEQ